MKSKLLQLFLFIIVTLSKSISLEPVLEILSKTTLLVPKGRKDTFINLLSCTIKVTDKLSIINKNPL